MPEPQSLKDVELAFLALLLRRRPDSRTADPDSSGEDNSNFFRATGKYYRAARKEVMTLAEAGLPLDEVAVILHLARHAAVEPEEVIHLRSERSWSEVLYHLNLTPEILYVPVSPPKGLAPKQLLTQSAQQAWSVLDLEDADIINLVNLRFISEHYGYRPEQVIALRSSGWSFTAIHASVTGPRLVESIDRRRRRPSKKRP